MQTQKKQQGQETDKSFPESAAVLYVNFGTCIKENAIKGKIHFKAKCAGKTLSPVWSFFPDLGVCVCMRVLTEGLHIIVYYVIM